MIANRRKALLPLTTLLVAGAIAVGSGATFTSSSSNAVSAVTSGTLSQSNSKSNAAIFNLSDVKPGDTLSGDLAITNTGSLPAAFTLTEVSSANAFTDNFLALSITNVTTGATVYTGTFGGLVDGTKNDLGTIAPGVANDFRFTVTLSADTTNANQGKTANAVYQWDSTQLNAGTVTQ